MTAAPGPPCGRGVGRSSRRHRGSRYAQPPSGADHRTGTSRQAQAHSLAVDREALGPEPLRRGRDRGQSRGPVICVAAVDPDHRAVPADDHPVTVMLDFVNPVDTNWWPRRCDRLGRNDEAGWKTLDPHGSTDRSATRVRPSCALQRMRPYRMYRAPDTAYAEMNEAVGGVQNRHGYDQSFEEGNERCHGTCSQAKNATQPRRLKSNTTPPLARASRCLAVELAILPEW
jgi:hypothetical protein